MKLAIVVGHNSVSQGAVRQDTRESEFVWNGRLARHIERLAGDYGIEVRTFFRTPGGGYSREIERVANFDTAKPVIGKRTKKRSHCVEAVCCQHPDRGR